MCIIILHNSHVYITCEYFLLSNVITIIFEIFLLSDLKKKRGGSRLKKNNGVGYNFARRKNMDFVTVSRRILKMFYFLHTL